MNDEASVLPLCYGATTFSIMTLSITAFSIKTLIITTFSIIDLIVTLSIKDTQRNDTRYKY